MEEARDFLGASFTPTYMSSYLLGVATLVAFSWQSLTRPTFKLTGRDRELLELFALPLSSGFWRFLRAWVLYTLVLLLTFSLICYMGPSFLQYLLPTQVGLGGETEDYKQMLPLFLSFAVVGIGQTPAYIDRIESAFRGLAHQFIGVPDNILDLRNTAATASIQIDQLTQGELAAIAPAYALADRAAETQPRQTSHDLKALLQRYYLFRHWFLSPNVTALWPSKNLKVRLSRLCERVERHLGECDELLASMSDDQVPQLRRRLAERKSQVSDDDSSVLDDALELQRRQDGLLWEQLNNRVEISIDGMALILALFAVNESRRPPQELPVLRRSIDRLLAAKSSSAGEITLVPMLTMALGVLGLSLVSFFVIGLIGTENSQSDYGQLLSFATRQSLIYTMSAIALYLPGALIGVSLWERECRRGHWRNEPGWLPNAHSYLRFFVCGLIASAIALHVTSGAIGLSQTNDMGRMIIALGQFDALVTSSVFGIIGGIIAALTVFIVDDHYRTPDLQRPGQVFWSVFIASLLVVLTCVIGLGLSLDVDLQLQNLADLLLAFVIANLYGLTAQRSLRRHKRTDFQNRGRSSAKTGMS